MTPLFLFSDFDAGLRAKPALGLFVFIRGSNSLSVDGSATRMRRAFLNGFSFGHHQFPGRAHHLSLNQFLNGKSKFDNATTTFPTVNGQDENSESHPLIQPH